MKHVGILARLEAALRKRNPMLVDDYLLPGLSVKTMTRRFRRISFGIGTLNDIYSWHDGTKFVNLAPGETFAEGIAKVSFLPIDTFLFNSSEQAIGMMYTMEEVSRRRPELKEGVWRYFPLLSGGGDSFMLDLDPNERSRIIFHNGKSADSFRVAYPTLDAFLDEIVHANDTGTRLCFLSAAKFAR